MADDIVLTESKPTTTDMSNIISTHATYYNVADAFSNDDTGGLKNIQYNFYIQNILPSMAILYVKDKNTHLPIAGVKPYIYLPAATGCMPTDSNGMSVLPLLPAGVFTLCLYKSGYQNIRTSVKYVAGKVQKVTIKMKPV
ncbi:MAG: carboxypeptidase D [Podoviridae sp. cty5g4]|nr:MAG: carboxypeptidase D [Podoviridae sp. cty5g4]